MYMFRDKKISFPFFSILLSYFVGLFLSVSVPVRVSVPLSLCIYKLPQTVLYFTILYIYNVSQFESYTTLPLTLTISLTRENSGTYQNRSGYLINHLIINPLISRNISPI